MRQQAAAREFASTDEWLKLLAAGLPNPQHLVRLNRQPPGWIGFAVGDCGLRVGCLRGALHWLQKTVFEVEAEEGRRVETWLGKHEFQFIAVRMFQGRAGFRRDANPVD